MNELLKKKKDELEVRDNKSTISTLSQKGFMYVLRL